MRELKLRRYDLYESARRVYEKETGKPAGLEFKAGWDAATIAAGRLFAKRLREAKHAETKS